MNTSRKIFLVGATSLAVAALASSAMAQNSATTAGDSSVTIINPISLTKGTALSFGRVVVTAPGTAASLVLSPAGVVSPTNLTSVGGTITAGTFTVSGEAGQAYVITLPASAALGTGCTLDTFTSTPSTTGTLPVGTGLATQTLTIGATLQIAANTAAGAHTGTYNVTVQYQ
jgi:hypothetical protein